MEYEQALIIGKRRRADAAMALGGYVREKAMEVFAVKPSKDSGLDARDSWLGGFWSQGDRTPLQAAGLRQGSESHSQ